MARTKTIIISDVHLSDGATPYSWFKDDSALKGFLSKTAKRADVKELVLLGDIFDLWLYPIDVKPWTAQRIIQQWSGTNSVVSALKECADTPDLNVFYINGNHDMGVTAADLALISPNIKVVTSDKYNADHANALRIEHGHLVDMFNAPDISGDAIQGLPFGYFITRMMATAQNHNMLWDQLADIVRSHLQNVFTLNNFMRQKRSVELGISFFDDWIEAWIENHIYNIGKRLVKILVDLLLDYIRVYHPLISENSPILLPDGSSVTIGEVKQHYHKLLLKWHQKLGNLPELYRSALASENLAWYAEKLLKSDPAKLVVMGHTHAGKTLFGYGGQYANSGCWVAGKRPSYVEIDPAASPKAVVKVWPDDTSLAPNIAWASPAIMAAPSQPMSDEAAWDEEPLPQFWQE